MLQYCNWINTNPKLCLKDCRLGVILAWSKNRFHLGKIRASFKGSKSLEGGENSTIRKKSKWLPGQWLTRYFMAFIHLIWNLAHINPHLSSINPLVPPFCCYGEPGTGLCVYGCEKGDGGTGVRGNGGRRWVRGWGKGERGLCVCMGVKGMQNVSVRFSVGTSSCKIKYPSTKYINYQQIYWAKIEELWKYQAGNLPFVTSETVTVYT